MVPYGTDTMTPSGRSPHPNHRGFPSGGAQQHGPPIHSMLERHSSAYSPLLGRSPLPVAAGQQSPFFGGGVAAPSPYGGTGGRPTTALGAGWGSSSSNGHGQSESFMSATASAGSSSSASNGAASASGGCYEDLEAMWRVHYHIHNHYHTMQHQPPLNAPPTVNKLSTLI